MQIRIKILRTKKSPPKIWEQLKTLEYHSKQTQCLLHDDGQNSDNLNDIYIVQQY